MKQYLQIALVAVAAGAGGWFLNGYLRPAARPARTAAPRETYSAPALSGVTENSAPPPAERPVTEASPEAIQESMERREQREQPREEKRAAAKVRREARREERKKKHEEAAKRRELVRKKREERLSRFPDPNRPPPGPLFPDPKITPRILDENGNEIESDSPPPRKLEKPKP